MLVLSRRADEKIIFPQAGITVHVLGVRGNAVKIGVEAPRDVKILRDELAGQNAPPAEAKPAAGAPAPGNRLGKIGMLTTLLEKQWAAGRGAEVEMTLTKLGEVVESLGHEWAARQAAGDRPAGKPARAKRRTLLVEDDANQRELLAGLLNLNGVECNTAEDGLMALDFLASHERPDVVLLDMHMPRCDGPETVARIRRDPRLVGLKVIAVSGTPPRELGLPTGPEGVDAWLPKPLNPGTLWDAIHNTLTTAGAN